MSEVSVYNYQSPRQYLLDALADRQRTSPGFSVRSLAREMGMKSHALLVMLLQGKRPLRVKHAIPIARGLGLSSQERLYLQALIQFDSAEDAEEKQLCSLWLADLHPARTFRTKELDEFSMIAHWIHTAILSMVEIPGFEGTPEDVVRRLGNKVGIHEARAALERLESLGLLIRNPQGLLEARYDSVTTRNDLRNEGGRKYHQTILALAIDAIENVPLSQREYQSLSLAVPRCKIPLAKEMIRKFRAQFVKAISSEGPESGLPAEEVCQLNIQFFQLTESPSGVSPSEDEGVDTEWKLNKPKKEGELPC